jgi:hypothetical protein
MARLGADWDLSGEPWFSECQRCGCDTQYGNRYCEACYYDVAGGPENDCPECGQQTEQLGELCLSCRSGWALYNAEEERFEIEKHDR